MDMRKYGSGPVRPDDVRDGPRQEKVADVSINERYDCPVLHFESGDSLMLSPPNSRTMCRAYTTDSNKWLDQEVELTLGRYTDNRGEKPEEKETVVLRPISGSADNGGTKAAPRLSARDDLDDEIPF